MRAGQVETVGRALRSPMKDGLGGQALTLPKPFIAPARARKRVWER